MTAVSNLICQGPMILPNGLTVLFSVVWQEEAGVSVERFSSFFPIESQGRMGVEESPQK